jgi:hypothetical protein
MEPSPTCFSNPMKFTLHDTFNDYIISRHRTLEGAVRADLAHARAVRRHNGPTSYIPTEIRCDGKRLDDDQIESAQGISLWIQTGGVR